jgi:hypothetical protein
MIMDSGAFEPANRTVNKFDDSSLKYYKFRNEKTQQQKAKTDTQVTENLCTDLSKITLKQQQQQQKEENDDDNMNSIDKENFIPSSSSSSSSLLLNQNALSRSPNSRWPNPKDVEKTPLKK